MDDFQKFHLRKAAKRRPLSDLSTQVNKLRPQSKSSKPPPQKPKTAPIGQILAIVKPLHTSYPRSSSLSLSLSRPAVLSQSLDSSGSKRPKLEPRYRDITREVIEQMQDMNELVSLSNASVRSFTQWYKLQNYSFVKRDNVDCHRTSHIGVNVREDANVAAAGDNPRIPAADSLLNAQVSSRSSSPHLVREAQKIGRYMLAVSLTRKKVRDCMHEGVHTDTFEALLMNPDSRISLKRNDKIFLSDEAKYELCMGSTMLPVYPVWKVAKTS